MADRFHQGANVVQRADLPATVRLYDLRHAATLLLQAGVPPKVISERLGHSTMTLTIETYSHVVPGLDADAANRLVRVLGEPYHWLGGQLGESTESGRSIATERPDSLWQ
jgi:integrase